MLWRWNWIEPIQLKVQWWPSMIMMVNFWYTLWKLQSVFFYVALDTAKQTVASFAIQKLLSCSVQCAVRVNVGLTGLSTVEWAASLVAVQQCSCEQVLLYTVHSVEHGVGWMSYRGRCQCSDCVCWWTFSHLCSGGFVNSLANHICLPLIQHQYYRHCLTVFHIAMHFSIKSQKLKLRKYAAFWVKHWLVRN